MKQYYAPSELIINEDGSVFHLHVRPEWLADKVILVGDPGRVDLVARHFTEKECDVQSREFHTVTGTYKDKRITVVSTGIGCDNIDIVLNELDALANIDFQTRQERDILRRLQLVRIAYAIHADEEMVERIARQDMVRGITIAAGGFFGPQGRELRVPLADPHQNEKVETFEWKELHVTNFEMESSALAGLSRLMGHQATTVCMVIANRRSHEANTGYKNSIDTLIETVLDRI